MANQIIIRGENPETTNIFEESPQIVNVIETNDVEVRIYEQGSESTNLTDENIFVNVYENEDVVVRIFEPGIRGATGAAGSGGSGSSSIPDGTISGSSQVIYSQITGVPSNLFSSSQQVNFSEISGSFSTSSFLQNSFTSSYNTFTASIETKVQRLENATSSYALKTEISGAFGSSSSSVNNIELLTGKYQTYSDPYQKFTYSASLLTKIEYYEDNTEVNLFASSSLSYNSSGSLSQIIKRDFRVGGSIITRTFTYNSSGSLISIG